MSDFGFVLLRDLSMFLAVAVFWLRFVRWLFDLLGFGPR